MIFAKVRGGGGVRFQPKAKTQQNGKYSQTPPPAPKSAKGGYEISLQQAEGRIPLSCLTSKQACNGWLMRPLPPPTQCRHISKSKGCVSRMFLAKHQARSYTDTQPLWCSRHTAVICPIILQQPCLPPPPPGPSHSGCDHQKLSINSLRPAVTVRSHEYLYRDFSGKSCPSSSASSSELSRSLPNGFSTTTRSHDPPLSGSSVQFSLISLQTCADDEVERCTYC